MPTPAPVAHFFTVDVEEHFHVSAFEGLVDRADWDRHESRVERNVGVLLDLLARHQTLGTFFTVGWVARKYPALVRRIADAGHEIASHTFWHRKVSRLTPEDFRRDIRDCKAALEDACGRAVRGFRAPSFSIRPGGEWAFDVLLEEGHVYDSSLFPIHRPDYGYPSAPPVPHVIRRPAGDLLEIPLATTVIGRARLPAAGGGSLRHFPLALVCRALREHEARGIPAMFYVHPWEIDPEQPRIAAPWLTRVRHYRGLERTLPRLERLLTEFRFTSVAAAFGLDARAPTDPWPGLAVA
jgi:polysaccharide deacetylase family protein (PEP-CTERM system associated)